MPGALKNISIERIIGIGGAVFTTFMYSSMLQIAWNNLHGVTVIWIQPVLTILNNLIWISYGILKKDIFIFLANISGVLVSVFTLSAIYINRL